MKKILSILFSLITLICVAFAFGGCGEKQLGEQDKEINSGENLMVEAQIIEEIKQIHLEYFLILKYPEATVDDITVTKYYGKFGDSYIAVIKDRYHWHAAVYSKETIKDLVFTYPEANPVTVINGSQLYTLKEAYLQSILTMEDLRELYKQFPEPGSASDASELHGEPIR